MYLRSLKKTAGDVSLSETLDVDGDGNNLYMIDVIAQECDMAEEVGNIDLCGRLNETIKKVLDEREAKIIRMRYGIGCKELTQKQTAIACGISRSYVSRIEKKALEKLRKELDDK